MDLHLAVRWTTTAFSNLSRKHLIIVLREAIFASQHVKSLSNLDKIIRNLPFYDALLVPSDEGRLSVSGRKGQFS